MIIKINKILFQCLMLGLMLSGCGGGGSDLEFGRAIHKSERSERLGFLPFSESSTASQKEITSEELLNWAEGTFPQFFASRQTTKQFENYQYRFYPETNVYLATDDMEQVWVLGEILTNGLLTKVGVIDDFKDTVIQVSSTYSIPVDLSQVVYPDSYKTVTTSANDQVNDPCLLDRSVIAVPRAWMDSRPLPEIKGAPLRKSIVRGVEIKDIGNADNPAFVLAGQSPDAPGGCTGDQKVEITRTLERLKSFGVQLVYMPYWHWVSKDPSGNWYYTEANETFGVLSDENLAHFGREAKRLGLQVVMFQQVQGMKDDWSDRGYSGLGRYAGEAYFPEQTMGNFQKFLQAHQNYMLEKAEVFEALGVTYWELGCHICVFSEWRSLTQEESDLYYESYKNLAVALRAKYTGKLLLHENFINSVPLLADSIDVIKVSWHPDNIRQTVLKLRQESEATIDDFESAFYEGLKAQFESLSSLLLHKELMIGFNGGQSRQNVLSFPGYVEETGCTTYVGSLNPSDSSSDCMQRTMTPDFALQAVIYEGFFRALSRAMSGLSSSSTATSLILADVWQTDNLIPQTAFPNIATSFRNKPAEAIVRSWFEQ